MCQLIEVTWFIWKLSADQLTVLLDREQCSVWYFLASLGSEHRKTDARQCCHPLTAVKTRYPLTSITWPYRGLRCRPIEVEYFFEVIRLQVTSFQMIAGSSLFLKIYLKNVALSLWPSTIKILTSNLPRTRKFSQLFKNTGGVDLLLPGHGLVTLYVQFLCCDWSKFHRWVHVENLRNILKLVYFLWQLILTESCVNLWCF